MDFCFSGAIDVNLDSFYSFMWRQQHVVGHHCYTNMNGYDPDISECCLWRCTTQVSLCINRSFVNKAFLQCECIMTWENCGAYIKHIIHVAPNYKTIISLTKEIMQIDTCWSPSHYLPSEPLFPYDLAYTHYNVRRGVGAQVMRVANCVCHKQVWEFKYHSSIQCSAFYHTWVLTMFSTSSTKFLEHQESLPKFIWISSSNLFFSVVNYTMDNV